MCVPVICNTKNRDWGADNLTYVLYLRWELSHDRSVLPPLRRLAQSAHLWLTGTYGSSDEMMWDSVAEVREYQVTGSKASLAKAEAAFRRVDADKAAGFAAGACPAVDYQWAHGTIDKGTKTLETDSNYVKAALLLYQVTGKRSYLRKAEVKYAAVRRYFLAPSAPLYTVFVIDNGKTCQQVPGQFLSSVNGNMIWDGSALAKDTGNRTYLSQALATARAVTTDLNDGAGVFADLQADIDVDEPLVEAMYDLAVVDHQRFARQWLLTSASAAASDVNAAGEFGRFFDGPPPTGEVTAWELNGGVALMGTAAALDPAGVPAHPGFWHLARFVPDSRGLAGHALRISFTGRAIAILGTIGEHCCLYGHARVLVDGVQTFNRVGIWQNRSSPARKLPDQVLFAWRWRRPGRHVIEILPGQYDPTEGGSFFAMTGYLLVK